MSRFPKLAFVVIHNNEEQRLGHVLPACRRLAKNVGATVIEVYKQPEIKPHSRMFGLALGVKQAMGEASRPKASALGKVFPCQPLWALVELLLRGID